MLTDESRRHRRKKKRRIVSKALLCKLGIGALLVLLIIGGLVGILVYALTQSKSKLIDIPRQALLSSLPMSVIRLNRDG